MITMVKYFSIYMSLASFLISFGTRFRGPYVVTEPTVFHIVVNVHKVGLCSLLTELTRTGTEKETM
jgi:hypothetical protein